MWRSSRPTGSSCIPSRITASAASKKRFIRNSPKVCMPFLTLRKLGGPAFLFLCAKDLLVGANGRMCEVSRNKRIPKKKSPAVSRGASLQWHLCSAVREHGEQQQGHDV